VVVVAKPSLAGKSYLPYLNILKHYQMSEHFEALPNAPFVAAIPVQKPPIVWISALCL
jgi:hypothetical protein